MILLKNFFLVALLWILLVFFMHLNGCMQQQQQQETTEERRPYLGEFCTRSEECEEQVFGSYCELHRCSCIPGFHAVLDMRCSENKGDFF